MANHEERIVELERRVEVHFKKFDISTAARVELDNKHMLWEALNEASLKPIFDLDLKVWCHDVDNFVKISRRVLYAVGISALIAFVGAILTFVFGGGLNR